MAEQSGVSQYEFNSKISELQREINALERRLETLEDEMAQFAAQVVDAISDQTHTLKDAIDDQKHALVAGVAATTLMIERTKQQMKEDFATTIARIERQTESTLQVELGKKLADAGGLRDKLEAFVGDIRARFDRALVGVNVNRELYNSNFRKILDDFDSKVKIIGSHILEIRDEDLAPALSAATFAREVTHGLPMEVDLKRLESRSRNLDETLLLLKSRRLDEVTGSLTKFDKTLSQFSHGNLSPNSDRRLVVEGLAVSSAGGVTVSVGRKALPTESQGSVNLSQPAPGFEPFSSADSVSRVAAIVESGTARDATGNEIVALRMAAERLAARGIVSRDAVLLLEDFLGSGSLKIAGA